MRQVVKVSIRHKSSRTKVLSIVFRKLMFGKNTKVKTSQILCVKGIKVCDRLLITLPTISA